MKTPVFPQLPILEALPALREALLGHSSVVLQAAPGAGKSTVVPLALLDEPWRGDRRLIMLEPRRLAARAVAERMASTLGEPVGQTVGYRMRLDTKVSARTRIEVVTEGVLTRMLQADAALAGVAAILFDEFHERSLQADTALAFTLDARAALELDLRVLVMSATLDEVAIAALLDHAPIIRCPGRMFPVASRYLGQGLPALPSVTDPLERRIAAAIRMACDEHAEGDVLVFLPGAAEIRRVAATLEPHWNVMPLYGELSGAEQDAALSADPHGRRRIILATNIAETSLTIPGVRVVVDSGLVRRSIFDPVTGMSRLETRRISRASAEQRAGRAGRVAPGVCYRLWGEGAERSLAAQTPAEILEADLAPLALELAQWGVSDAAKLRWLDAPTSAMLAAARSLLTQLAALDGEGKITAEGQAMAEWAVHPRLARLLCEASRRGMAETGASIAALLAERDLLRKRRDDTDFLGRLEILEREGSLAPDIDRGTLQRAKRLQQQFLRRMSTRSDPPRFDHLLDAAGLIACAYPDRIGARRGTTGRRFLLSNGRGAEFVREDRLARSDWIVAIDLDDSDRDARIQLAVATTLPMLRVALASAITRHREVFWSDEAQAVTGRDVEKLGALVLEERALQPLPKDEALLAMIQGIEKMGLEALPWDDAAHGFCARVEFARKRKLADSEAWQAFDTQSLLADLSQWLGPWLEGVSRRSHLVRLPLLEALHFRLGHAASIKLDQHLPTHIELPSGSRVKIDYQDDLAPVASMRMQEVFGLAATPRIGAGAVPVTFKLLSPAQRPLQVTQDLASFWRNAYREVRKDMRGRYPRHYWPEDPLQAEPRRGIKPR